MFLTPDLNCALLNRLKVQTNKNSFPNTTLVDQCVHVSTFGRSPVYVANVALAKMNALKILRIVAFLRNVPLC